MRKLLCSFFYAFTGIFVAVRSQRNMKIHLLAVAVVSAAGAYYKISSSEWLAVFLCFALVITLEMMNTAIELLADKLHPEKNKQIGKVKDVAAGAVLVAAMFSVAIAVVVFGKYFF